MAKPSPQQRWQVYRQTLPQWSKRRKRFVLGGSIFILLCFTLFVLPYLLPLAGPKPQDPQSLADPNGHFFEFEGQSIYYEHYVNNGQTVLLIHGQAGSTRTWRETMPALQNAGYNVYAVDMLGLGLSDKGKTLDYSYPHQAAIIEAFMAEEGIASVYLVAHAFGANVGVRIAQDEPAKVQGLILVAPTLFTDPSPEIPQWIFDLGFVERWSRVALHFVVHEAVGEQLRSATKMDTVVTDALIADYARVLSTPDWDLAVLGMLRDSHHNVLDHPLSAIQVPVLLLWGMEDGWATPDHAEGLLQEFRTSCLVTFAGVGHLPMHEVPTDFSQSLIEFLQESCNNQTEQTNVKVFG